MATCASLTTGTTVFMADPCKDNTLAKIEAYTENFLIVLEELSRQY